MAPAPLRILLLCHSFNSLSQRLFCELRALGHEVSVELDIADRVTEEAIELFRPALVIAPFLKRLIQPAVWQRQPCLIVHPGPVGDRGPAALDWAVRESEADWGVTVLQANEAFDAGPVWAHAGFAMRAAAKGSLYRREVAEAAVDAVLRAVAHFSAGGSGVEGAERPAASIWRGPLRQADRRIDWSSDASAIVLAKIRSADGHPGVQDELFGQPCRVFDAHAATTDALDTSPPGALIGRRDGAVLRRTIDGAVWIGHASLASACGGKAFKLPCDLAFGAAFEALPASNVPLERASDEWGEIRYQEFGAPGARVGCLSFEFYNGAMSTAQCRRLLAAWRDAAARDTRVLMLAGGADFFSNGIHLNCIEAASSREGDSAADESMRNIEAMDDLAEAVIRTTDRLTVALLRGNAAAGGAFLALAADEVWAHRGVVLNPHYKNMGNLYGSEYWTYLLPRRLGDEGAAALMAGRLPLGAPQAQSIGLIDRCMDVAPAEFEALATTHAAVLAAAHNIDERIAAKARRRKDDEIARPLADYRLHELSRMHRNFYGFDPSFHVARYHFVHKLPMAWTPRHLTRHRDGMNAASAR
ncbi:putative two-component system hydrogenase maturation factor HypX/HoxX [Variovorax paradoxus]|uniref:enoyl-CoA hydratase-related protein n=1 Tax=Variovorax paradoxus TaxID=34073 RepID=UPI002788F971|nr:enoyl-CoA hydratase-related protein [Variovorax paradoxus]MDQ0027392.1 putative two-component system hydrogenase maturation factor HypX/HoxX [Variovorax paradoxus]